MGWSCCPRAINLGSIPEIQELLTLGQCLVSLWCFLGAVRCQGLGTWATSSCPHLYYLWFSPHSVILKHGVRGCRLSDAIRIIAHFTPCHLSDRTHTASDSPTGSFSTWHLEGTLDDVRRQSWSHAGCGQESPGLGILGARAGPGAVEHLIHPPRSSPPPKRSRCLL